MNAPPAALCDCPAAPEEANGPPPAARPDAALGKTALSVFGQAVASGTSFFTAVAVGRTCSRADFGTYSLALTIVLFLRAVQSDVVAAPYTVYCSRHRGDALATYTGSALAHHLALSALMLIGLVALAGLLASGVGSARLAPVAWVLLGAVPFLLLRDHARQYALAHLRLGTALVLDLGAAAVQLGSLALLAGFGLLTVPAAYAIMGATCALTCLVWFLARRQPLRVDRRRVVADWHDNWAFARWALGSQLVGRAAGYLMPWILAVAHGEAATGILAACITLSNLVGTFISGVGAYLTPRAAHAFTGGGLTALRRVLRQTATLYLITVGAFCLVVFVVGEKLVSLVYGTRYAGTGPVLALLALGMLANSLGITAGNGLWALDRPRANFLADVCTLVVALAALLALVGPLGVLGAAVATFAGAAAGAAVRSLTLFRLMASSPQLAAPGRAVP